MLNIIMTTYCPEPGHPRGEYALLCATALRNKLLSPELMRFVLANDGPTDQPHVEAIVPRFYCRDDRTWLLPYTVGGPRAGIGGSLNRALDAVGPSDLWLYTTDDWLLTSDYDLTQALRLIRELDYQYVRLGPPHPNIDCRTRFQAGLGWWLDLHHTNGGYVFATRPFIATKQFCENVGPFKENCDAYECERDYSDRVSASRAAGMAEVVSGSLEGPFEHIGEAEVGDTYP